MKGICLFLGTGASAGVPLIGCHCRVCTSSNPHNARLRPSALLQLEGGKKLLIDIGPDFRQQALSHQIDRLDGLLLTHTHYDHIAGIDELRVLNYRQQKPIDCLLSQESFAELSQRYHYLFKEQGSAKAQLQFHRLPHEKGVIDFAGISIGYNSYWQAGMKVNGFRFGNFAYVTDIRDYTADIFPFLEGVETLVLSALKAEPSKVHFSFEEAVDFARKAGAQMTWLTHLSHAVDEEESRHLLPPEVQLAYDGLSFPFEVAHA